MAVHDKFDLQLHKLNFLSYMDLSIEIKKHDQEFEEYNTDWLYIRVLKHVDDEVYDFRSIDKLPTQIIRVNKKIDTVADFESKVSDLYEISQDKLIILMRHEHIYNNTVRSELYNMDWRKPKTIEDASRLDHGAVLYVEEGDPSSKLETFKWH